ncbi:MAG TPA: sugar ABC transporter ATP-binding protein [Caldimonas sp.]|jgi:ABC-type sugar transport system ATPase subunit
MPDASRAVADPAPGTAPLLELRGVGKRYGAMWALEGVDLAARAGEVHALLGANGAGKTTLLHVLGGITSPSAGEIRFDGRPVVLRSPADAARAGIASVHQELAVLPQLTVAENVWLAREPRTAWAALDRRAMRRQTVELLDAYGLPLDPDATAGTLSVAGRQLVEIARALSASTRILALDEPSAVLSMRERDRLFEIVRRLKAKGLLVLFVSHRLEEAFEITDRVTVLRNGRKVFEGETAAVSRGELVRQMVGHAVDDREAAAPRRSGASKVVVEVRPSAAEPVAMELRAGEIVGLGGLVGGGRTRLARRLAGLDLATTATYRIGDEPPFTIRSARQAIEHGIVYLTEDRKRDGLFLDLPVASNASAASLGRIVRFGVLTARREQASVAPTLARLQLVSASLRMPVRRLSGGNQQKVLFGRALLARPRLLVCDEPTRGVDVGAREEIYRVIESLAEAGVAVVVISSDLKELLALSHRVLVVRAARIVADLPPTAQERDIIEAAMPA